MDSSRTIWRIAAAALLTSTVASVTAQRATFANVPESVLREYAGTYRWDRDHFLYLQMCSELAGKNQLVAFDGSGEVRTLYPTDRDRFFTGPGAATPTGVESGVEFRRDRT